MAEAASPWPTAAEPEFAVVDESAAPAEPAAATAEIDLSTEWDDSVTVEADTPAVEAPAVEVAGAASDQDAEPSKADETVEEIRFYLAHGMPEQAMAALAKFQTLSRDEAKIAELRAEVEAAQPAPEEASAAVEPVIEELTADDIPTLEVTVDETPAAVEEPATAEPEPPAVEEIPVVAEAPAAIEPEPPVQAPVQAPVHVHQPVRRPAPAPQPAVLQEFVSDLETSLGDGFLPGTVTKPVAPPAAKPATTQPAKPAMARAARTQPVVAAAPTAPVLGEFVADIEASLGEDFLTAAPVAKSQTAAPVHAPVVAPKVVPPLAASAAASASAANHVAPPAPQVAMPAPAVAAPSAMASVAWHAPVADAPRPQSPAVPVSHAPVPPPAAAKASPFGDDAGVDLAEMFGELKQDLEADVASADADPETHYNLGIAFREMGLLDEAIGELQKACQSFDQGHAIPADHADLHLAGPVLPRKRRARSRHPLV